MLRLGEVSYPMLINAGNVHASQIVGRHIMQPNSQPDNAFHCVVPIELSRAKLIFWGYEIPIEILSISRDEFSFIVSCSSADKIQTGKKYRLQHRGDEWEVECLGHEALDDVRHVVVVKRLKDRTRYENVGNWWSQIFKSHQKADPIIVFALAVGFIVSYLLLPGWGEDLGTTRPITDMVQHCIDVIQFALHS